MRAYEKIGSFYLGRRVDPASQAKTSELLLYDANDLTTHAVCVGMTGSGKTGLCLCLLEEAVLDGVPVLAIDPKGDLGSLLLTFPELRPEDFAPWIDEAEAQREGLTPLAAAASAAERWRTGLAEWDQDAERIARLRAGAEFAIYTPGSTAGLPVQVLGSLDAPPAPIREDTEALAEKVTGVASGLLALLGREADPLQSREHVLIANLLQNAWSAGRSLGLADLIREIQTPPLARIGVLDVDSFFPPRDRAGLALSLNNLLASPGFAAWLEGEPLDVQRLLWSEQGRPRVAIFSIAHLPDAARMFFVTLLLQEVVSWMRAQAGTSSLRAILYMDEIFGFFPPTANPPSKPPMLTLLKQARAMGLGCVLATQNPVDLDYKGLANAGTWFLGRLQTERDKERILDGLTGTGGGSLDRGRLSGLLSNVKNRVFLMHNVHEAEPVLFQSRWAMSYLRGPLTRVQIQKLMEGSRKAGTPGGTEALAGSASQVAAAAPVAATPPAPEAPRPAPPPAYPSGASSPAPSDRAVLPPEAREAFLPAPPGAPPSYRPAILALARLHYAASREGIDLWQTAVFEIPIQMETQGPNWEALRHIGASLPPLDSQAGSSARFEALPPSAVKAASYARWTTQLRDHLYRSRPLVLWKDALTKATSNEGETEGDFRVRLVQQHRELRDQEIEKLRERYAPRLARLQDRIQTAEARAAREQEQLKEQNVQAAISIGASVLGAFLGRRRGSVSTLGRATTAARGMGRAARQRGDVAQAHAALESAQADLRDLDAQFAAEAAALQQVPDPASMTLTELRVPARKADIAVERFGLVWIPR